MVMQRMIHEGCQCHKKRIWLISVRSLASDSGLENGLGEWRVDVVALIRLIVPRERMRSPQPSRNYSVEIPTWSTHTQRRRLSARRAAKIAG